MNLKLTPQQMGISLLDAFSELMITLDLDLRVHWANQKAGDLVNDAPENLVGQYCYQVIRCRQTLCEDCPVPMTIQSEEKQEIDWEAPDGRYYNLRSYPLYSQEGFLEGVAVVGLDISVRKREEQALRKSVERFHWAMEATQEGVWDWDLTTDEVYYSPFYVTMLGYTRNEVHPNAKFWLDHLHPEDKELALRANKECIDNQRKIFEIEFRMMTKNCEVRWILGQGKAVSRDKHGRATRLVGTHADITQRKQMELELHQRKAELVEQEELYRSLVEDHPHFVELFLLDTTIIFANKALAESIGYTPKEIQGKKWIDFIPGNERNHVFDMLSSFSPEEPVQTNENSFVDHYGTQRWHIWTNRAFFNEQNEIRYFQSTGAEITERKNMEEMLLQSQNYYRTLFESSGVAIVIFDDDTTIYQANSNFEKLSGYSRQEVERKKYLTELIHPDDMNSLQDKYYLYRHDSDSAPRLLDFRIITRNGQERYVLTSLDRIPGTDRYIASVIDNTERKQIEEELRHSEKKFRHLFEKAEEGILLVRGETIEFANPALERITGYTIERLSSEPFINFIHPEHRQTMRDFHLRLMQEEFHEKRVDCKVYTNDGSIRWINLHGQLIEWDGIKANLSFVTDITERKKIEKTLEEMSFHDSLTGLYNRNFFEAEMTRLSNGRHNPLGIIVCDLDGLKFINDTLGHHAGDQMLKQTANMLQNNVRSSDIIARIGGDEFAILLTETDSSMAEKLVQRLRQSVQEYNSDDPEIPLSLSIGYTLDEEGIADMQALFREADNRMYREKLQREESARSDILQALTVSMEARDFNTENHCDRLQELVTSLAQTHNISHDYVNDLYLLARFHDMGKVGIPDHILFKPGALTEEEWQQMRQHCEIGHRIASSVPDLEPIADWILKHHERWDGQGYPLGLSDEDIPLPCRILAIADAYDAMTSDRPYRKAMSHKEAVRELQRCAGTQFDPELVEKFIQVLQEINYE